MAVRRRPVLVEFTDQFGEQQVIHRGSGSRLAIRRKEPTTVLALTRSIGSFIGDRIKEERIKAGLSMDALAERAGLKGGKQAIYHVEQALNTGIRIGTLYAIAIALNISSLSLLPSAETAISGANVAFKSRDQLTA